MANNQHINQQPNEEQYGENQDQNMKLNAANMNQAQYSSKLCYKDSDTKD